MITLLLCFRFDECQFWHYTSYIPTTYHMHTHATSPPVLFCWFEEKKRVQKKRTNYSINSKWWTNVSDSVADWITASNCLFEHEFNDLITEEGKQTTPDFLVFYEPWHRIEKVNHKQNENKTHTNKFKIIFLTWKQNKEESCKNCHTNGIKHKTHIGEHTHTQTHPSIHRYVFINCIKRWIHLYRK